MKDVSILLPVFNEEQDISRVVKTIQSLMPEAEIVVADDGSTDRSLQIAYDYASSLVKVIALSHQGKGSAIRHAAQAAGRPLVVQLDADLQFLPESIPSLLEPIRKGEADIILGSRYIEGAEIEPGVVSLFKRWASFVMASLISWICRQHYTDIFAGIKAWKRESFDQLHIQENGFAYEAEIVIRAKRRGLRVLERPVKYVRRRHGRSNIRIVYHTVSMVWSLLKIIMRRSP